MNVILQNVKIVLLSVLFLGGSIVSQAQVTETGKSMFWTTLELSKKVNKQFKITYEQLHSYHFAKGRMNFIQSSLGLNYKPIKPLQLSFNYIPTFSLDDNPNNQLMYHRLKFRAKYYTRLSKRLRMYNSLNLEHNFNQFSKFKQRYYLRNDFYYRDKSLPWRLRPFIEQRLYWYQGGRDLQYYSAPKVKAEKVAPNGLHAYRLKLGVKVYPLKRTSFKLYFLQQKEFNTTLLGTREINYQIPGREKVIRKFYDFSVWGLSLSYSL